MSKNSSGCFDAALAGASGTCTPMMVSDGPDQRAKRRYIVTRPISVISVSIGAAGSWFAYDQDLQCHCIPNGLKAAPFGGVVRCDHGIIHRQFPFGSILFQGQTKLLQMAS